jgi:hypothetical protein
LPLPVEFHSANPEIDLCAERWCDEPKWGSGFQ